MPSKRLFAWLIDILLIALLTAIAVPFTLFLGLFFLPVLFGILSFLYRWSFIARHSSTPGMRMMGIELRASHGGKLDGGGAFLHTLGYFISVITFPLQIVSIALMLMSARKQGLTDHIMGTAAINRIY